jgi:uncharacterized protein
MSTINNKVLLDLVRTAITDKVNGTKSVDRNKFLNENPEYNNRVATFVTININGNLRGCIGTLVAHNKLFDDVTLNAQKAASEDPRFLPLTKAELDSIEIEVSLLSEQLEIKYKDLADLKSKIDIGNDGVVIRQGDKRATFLPQVWEQLPDFNEFFAQLFYKAGISSLDKPIDVFVYQVKKIK